MKKLILIVCATILVGTSVQAQSINIGARGGLNFANISESGGGSTVSFSTRTSIFLGGYATIMFNDKFGIQPELFYSSVGTVDKTNSPSTTVKLNYISLPVLFRYKFNDMFHLLAGPQLGILASAKATTSGTTVDIKNSLQSSDFSAVIGLGADFGPFNGGVRYNAGLSNISKSTGVTDKNNVVQIVVGYKLFGK